jgi:hypothetical protein
VSTDPETGKGYTQAEIADLEGRGAYGDNDSASEADTVLKRLRPAE